MDERIVEDVVPPDRRLFAAALDLADDRTGCIDQPRLRSDERDARMAPQKIHLPGQPLRPRDVVGIQPRGELARGAPQTEVERRRETVATLVPDHDDARVAKA